jgi:uncharacterized membrane protein
MAANKSMTNEMPGNTVGVNSYSIIRNIDSNDLKDVLSKGLEDFKEKPSHVILLVIIYPIIGLILANFTAGEELWQLIFPIMSGFALIGPLAAIALYELSRRRELGLDTSWIHAVNVIHCPSIFAIIKLSIMLGVIYFAWLGTAQLIFLATLGDAQPPSIAAFMWLVVTTSAGWALMFIGCAAGFVFAVIVLATSAVSFPMLLDRDVSMSIAVQTSVKVFLANPKTMFLWGGVVVVFLVAGSLPFFIGLAVAMPVLGHATWHLYRKTVAQ